MEDKNLLEQMKQIVKDAGEIILKAQNIESDIESKSGSANYVTKYDVEVQNFLYQQLSALFPIASFIGEEDLKQGSILSDECFIIDPIDGTTNFIFDIKHSSISVALMKQGTMNIGIVYNPYLNELFYAEKGNGAYKNDQPLKIKEVSISDGVIGFGTSPYYLENAEKTFDLAKKLFLKALDIRRSGSAALDLCYVASNRFALFFEYYLSPWDYAAASLIIKEAGGMISTIEKGMLPYDKPCSIIAANPAAFEEFFSEQYSL